GFGRLGVLGCGIAGRRKPDSPFFQCGPAAASLQPCALGKQLAGGRSTAAPCIADDVAPRVEHENRTHHQLRGEEGDGYAYSRIVRHGASPRDQARDVASILSSRRYRVRPAAARRALVSPGGMNGAVDTGPRRWL